MMKNSFRQLYTIKSKLQAENLFCFREIFIRKTLIYLEKTDLPFTTHKILDGLLLPRRLRNGAMANLGKSTARNVDFPKFG